MVVVPPPRPHFREPRSVSAGVIAKNLLYRRMNKDTLDLRIGCRELDQPSVKRCPATKINVEWISQHGHGHHVLSFLTREQTIWHRRQPNVSIQANLMACVPPRGRERSPMSRPDQPTERASLARRSR